MSSFLIKRGPSACIATSFPAQSHSYTAWFFSLRTLSRIAPAANNFKPIYICVLNNQSKKPPCSQIKPTFWIKVTGEQFEPQSKLIF